MKHIKNILVMMIVCYLPLSPLYGFVPQIDDREFTLIMVTRGLESADDQLSQKVLEIAEESYPELQKNIQEMLSVSTGVSQSLSKTTETIKTLVKKHVDNEQLLPKKPFIATLYFVPMDTKSPLYKKQLAEQRLNLVKQVSLPDQSSLQLLTYNFKESDKRADKIANAEIFAMLSSSIDAIRDAASKNASSYYFSGLALKLQLQQNNSFYQLQLLAGMGEQTFAIGKENEQVKISDMVISSPSRPSNQAATLVTIRQHLSDTNKALPRISVEFGAFGGLAGPGFGSTIAESYGDFQLLRHLGGWASPADECQGLRESMPSLVGELGKKPIDSKAVQGVLKLLSLTSKKIPVTFYVQKMQVDVIENRIYNMEVRFDVLGQKCLDIEGVNQQFGAEFTATMQEVIGSMYQQDNTADLALDLMYTL